MKGSLATAAGVGLASSLTARVRANVKGANDDIRVAIVGIRDKGNQHIDDFRKIDGVRVVALCDVDKDILAERAKKFAESNEEISTYTDVRRVLDDKDIDAVVIATPKSLALFNDDMGLSGRQGCVCRKTDIAQYL